MAFIAGQWAVNFTFRDNNGKIGACSVYYSSARTFDEVNTALADLRSALESASNAKLVDYSILRLFNNDSQAAPPPESEVERKLRVPLNSVQRPNATSIEVPSPVFGMEVDGTDVVDPADPAVVALIDALTQGSIGAGTGPVTWFGEDLIGAGSPVIVHRSRAARR